MQTRPREGRNPDPVSGYPSPRAFRIAPDKITAISDTDHSCTHCSGGLRCLVALRHYRLDHLLREPRLAQGRIELEIR